MGTHQGNRKKDGLRGKTVGERGKAQAREKKSAYKDGRKSETALVPGHRQSQQKRGKVSILKGKRSFVKGGGKTDEKSELAKTAV